MKHKWHFIYVIITALVVFGCEYTAYEPEAAPEVTDDVSFSADVEPIFSTAGCTACHGGNQKPDLTAGNAYESLTSDPKYIDLDNEDNIYAMGAPDSGHFKNYTAEQAAIVKKWIELDAPNN
ncbi:MAG: hypothetical protein R6U85_04460 [Salinivirgaceae bacterium]